MPFYEYECPSCRHHAEVMQKISDAPLKKCPSCGKNGLKRLISAPVFRLKGSGWYETDFKSDKEGKRNLAGPDREESKPAETTAAESATGAAGKADKAATPDASAAKPAAAAKSESGGGGDAKRSRRAAAKPVAKPAARALATRPRAAAARKTSGAGRKRK